MEHPKFYENYPCRIILFSNLVSIALYLIGIYIISLVGFIWAGIYILYILWIEARVMKNSCTNCFYYGKYCAFGKGKISSWFFKKGNLYDFIKRKITWKDVFPDFLVSIIPLTAGIMLLVINFNWLLLISIFVLVILASAGNAFVRGSLACRYCKQKEIGCPAERLFSKSGH